jgi:hypothetical protein
MENGAGMTTTLSTEPRRRSRLFWGLGGIAVVLAAVAALASWQASRPMAYKRYVSPPLRDGSRLPFLYPAFFGPVKTFAPGDFQSVEVFSPPNPARKFLERSPFLVQLFHVNDIEIVQFSLMGEPSRFPLSSSMSAAASRTGRYLRTDMDYSAPPWNGSYHCIDITDRQTGIYYHFVTTQAAILGICDQL